MTPANSAPASRPERDALSIAPGQLRDTVSLTIDRELADDPQAAAPTAATAPPATAISMS